jgi:hypothetical protein
MKAMGLLDSARIMFVRFSLLIAIIHAHWITQIVARQHIPGVPSGVDHRCISMALPHFHRNERWSGSRSSSTSGVLARKLVFLHRRSLWEESSARGCGIDVPGYPVCHPCACALSCGYRNSYDIHPHLSPRILHLCHACNMRLGEPPDAYEYFQARPR